MGAQDELISCHFDIPDRTSSVFQNSIHIELAFAIRRERVVMAVEEHSGAGQEPGLSPRRLEVFHRQFGNATLTEEIHSHKIAAK